MKSDAANTGTEGPSLGALYGRVQLGRFLRRRREQHDPDALGIARGRRRLAKGLRREEVAELADIGVVWYTWLEQGRPINIAEDTLHRVAAALKLSGEETAYVFQLAGKFGPAEVPGQLIFSAGADVQAALDAFAGPASAMNLRYDVVAWNGIAARVFGYSVKHDWRRNNRMWSKFFTPEARLLFRDWEHSAENLVAMFRSMATPHLGNARFKELLGELSQSPEFVALWERTAAVGREPTSLVELFVDGHDFDVYSIRATLPSAPELVLFLNPPANHATKELIDRLS
jgi:transcriptional regulator with XRE-family HTH domain